MRVLLNSLFPIVFFWKNYEFLSWSIWAFIYNYEFSADRFDRIRDFTKTVVIVPILALSGGNSLIT